MQAFSKITIGEIGVREQLAMLGLTPEDLIEAIQFGETHRALCTPDDPPSYPGVTSWARTVRGLRIGRLRDEGWKADDSGNYSTLVNKNGALAIAVATGDENTGIYAPDKPFASPGLKYPKGDMTRRAIQRNSTNPYLFPDMAEDARTKQEQIDAADNRITWILLRRRDKDTVYCELSLPWVLSDAGHILSWKHRIILKPLDVDPLLDILGDSNNEPGEVIEVPVQRR